jgi:hypothetical protein
LTRAAVIAASRGACACACVCAAVVNECLNLCACVCVCVCMDAMMCCVHALRAQTDSALLVAMCVRCIGARNVRCFVLPGGLTRLGVGCKKIVHQPLPLALPLSAPARDPCCSRTPPPLLHVPTCTMAAQGA